MILTALLLATHPCGIEEVRAVRGGVTVSFTYSRKVEIRRDGRNRAARIGRTPVRLLAGETLMIRGVHDLCTLTLRTKDGQPGVEVYSWMSHIGNDGTSEETVFVPAQRR
jgi:hypothetical protein